MAKYFHEERVLLYDRLSLCFLENLVLQGFLKSSNLDSSVTILWKSSCRLVASCIQSRFVINDLLYTFSAVIVLKNTVVKCHMSSLGISVGKIPVFHSLFPRNITWLHVCGTCGWRQFWNFSKKIFSKWSRWCPGSWYCENKNFYCITDNLTITIDNMAKLSMS